MGKRSHEDFKAENVQERDVKRQKPNRADRFSILSDELLLRILCFLPRSDLVLCERLSRRLQTLASDNQVWRSLYRDRFVKTRAERWPQSHRYNCAITGRHNHEPRCRSIHDESMSERRFRNEKSLAAARLTTWKKRYRLQHNWARGSARIKETEVAEHASTPPLLVRLHEGLVIIVDEDRGLRAWSIKDEEGLVATQASRDEAAYQVAAPTALAIDVNAQSIGDLMIIVGYADGRFSAYCLRKQDRRFIHQYTHSGPLTGPVSAIAYSSPYLLTTTIESRLELYAFPQSLTDMKPPTLLSSLKSHTAYSPNAIAIKTTDSCITASIAFAMPGYVPDWTIAIQELRLDTTGTMLSSRLASAANASRAFGDRLALPHPGSSRPSSISYNHPYLLTANRDNTMSIYIVTSTPNKLMISSGVVLWGHTSAISGAHVGDRGKAVSISTRGNDIRVWELEGRGSSRSSRTELPVLDSSVRVQPEVNEMDRVKVLPPYPNFTESGSDTSNGWVAFDEEKVVLLREKEHGAQAVVVYDFT